MRIRNVSIEIALRSKIPRRAAKLCRLVAGRVLSGVDSNAVRTVFGPSFLPHAMHKGWGRFQQETHLILANEQRLEPQ